MYPPPRRPRVDLTLVGDWGTANFHTVLGWIAAHLRWRSAAPSRFVIRTASAYREGIEWVGTGEADLAITTPSTLGVGWAYEGRGFYAPRAFRNLRTLGHLPQDDRLAFALRADLGIRSFAELRERRPVLQVATPLRDENNLCSHVIDLVLRAHGIEPDDILHWGGRWLDHDSPRVGLQAAIDGHANAVFNEAIMIPPWCEWARRTPLHFLPIEPEAMRRLRDDHGLEPAQLEPGRVLNEAAVPCLDWSNWAIVVRDDMPEDLAWEITSILVEERAELEGRFRHLPQAHSPLSWPIEPRAMPTRLGAPLHPGAERYYREQGLLTP